ncbi:hypothetical protein Pmani_021548 [Petrolisthes manimaculis]|uniref:Uncharacterized protein n=1 Tax=Petrolisthes manimaculis TaxID=1843537 RepID=A0AAE1PG98_9EUCA|nr:hypothetical protein Pmani_021548 [Petrolisthes manimaculis]
MSLKVESWATQDIKEQFTYWDGRKIKIPEPAGFIHKSAILREIEEVQDDTLWEPSRLMERMMSVFLWMCIKEDGSDRIMDGSCVTVDNDGSKIHEDNSSNSSSNVHCNIMDGSCVTMDNDGSKNYEDNSSNVPLPTHELLVSEWWFLATPT